MLDISNGRFIEAIIDEMGFHRDRRAQELLVNPADRRNIWAQINDPINPANIMERAFIQAGGNLIDHDYLEDWIFGMCIVYLRCIPQGRAVVVDELDGNPLVVTQTPEHLVVIPCP